MLTPMRQTMCRVTVSETLISGQGHTRRSHCTKLILETFHTHVYLNKKKYRANSILFRLPCKRHTYQPLRIASFTCPMQ